MFVHCTVQRKNYEENSATFSHRPHPRRRSSFFLLPESPLLPTTPSVVPPDHTTADTSPTANPGTPAACVRFRRGFHLKSSIAPPLREWGLHSAVKNIDVYGLCAYRCGERLQVRVGNWVILMRESERSRSATLRTKHMFIPTKDQKPGASSREPQMKPGTYYALCSTFPCYVDGPWSSLKREAQ